MSTVCEKSKWWKLSKSREKNSDREKQSSQKWILEILICRVWEEVTKSVNETEKVLKRKQEKSVIVES